MRSSASRLEACRSSRDATEICHGGRNAPQPKRVLWQVEDSIAERGLIALVFAAVCASGAQAATMTPAVPATRPAGSHAAVKPPVAPPIAANPAAKAGEAVDPATDGRVQEHQDRCKARQTLGAPRGGCGDGRPSDRDEDVNRRDRSLWLLKGR